MIFLRESTIIRDKKNLESYFDISEGIENKIFKSALVAKNYDDLLSLIKSKRYTMTRIKRCLNNILLGVTKEEMEFAKKIDTIPYVRILAFNSKGREIIREIKKSSEIKIINKFSEIEHFMDDEKFKFLIENDIKCTDIYNTIEIIREIKKSSEIKIINKFSEIEHFMDDEKFKFLIENDIKCTDIYNTIYYKKNRSLLKEIKIINKFSEIEHFMDDEKFKFLIENDIKCTDIYNTIYYKKNRSLLKGSTDYFIKPIYVR